MTPAPLPIVESPSKRWALWPEPEPLFGLIEALGVLVGVVLAGLASELVVLVLMSPAQRRGAAVWSTDPKLVLPVQLAVYLLVFVVLWRLFRHYHQVGVFAALRWHWPRRWLPFLAGGVALALAVQAVSQLLPMPPELPIDRMLRAPVDAWLMCAFGVLIAPLAEEAMFRGLLFPALARHLGAWGSLLVTAVLFGAVHAQQLSGAWIQVSLIALVGATLTAVRWRFRSLASSTLVHAGYNATLFFGLFVQTHGFTNFTVH